MTDIVSLDDYRPLNVTIATVASFDAETEEQLDERIDNGESIERGVGGITRLRRIQRGTRLTKSNGANLLPGSRLSQTEMNRRSEERVAGAAYLRGDLTDEDIRDMGWKKIVAKARNKPSIAQSQGKYEWYTPQLYVDAARQVMGVIDLDPASSEIANRVVRATEYYTEADDGLEQEWYGNVWMNPPYTMPLIVQFVDKLVASEFTQAIVLVNNATDTRWFQTLIEGCAALCLTDHRIKFIDTDGDRSSPVQGQAFLYFGDNPEAFRFVFNEIGSVWRML